MKRSGIKRTNGTKGEWIEQNKTKWDETEQKGRINKKKKETLGKEDERVTKERQKKNTHPANNKVTPKGKRPKSRPPKWKPYLKEKTNEISKKD